MALSGHLLCFEKNLISCLRGGSSPFRATFCQDFHHFHVFLWNDRTRNFMHSSKNALRIWRLRKRERKWLNSVLVFQAKMHEQGHVSSVQKLDFLWKSSRFFYLTNGFSLQNKQFQCFLFFSQKNHVWIVKGIWPVSRSNSSRFQKKNSSLASCLQCVFAKT